MGLVNRARWWNIQNQSQPNQGTRPPESPCICIPLQDGRDLGARRALRQDVQGALRRRDLHLRRQDLQLLPQEGPHRTGLGRRRGGVGPQQDEGHQRGDAPPRRRL